MVESTKYGLSTTSDLVLLKEGVLVISGRRAKPLWLSGLQFPFPGNGIVCFEARGASDIGVFFSSTPEDVHEDDQVLTVESSQRAEYETVIGSYCNKKSVIRKRGVVRALSSIGVGSGVEQSTTTTAAAWQSFDNSWNFEKYWICIKDGVIVVGKGSVGSCVFLKWEDSEPVRSSFQIGVSSWHQPVIFRFFEVFPTTEGLIPSTTKESLSFISNFFLVARNYFNRCFHDIFLESSDGSLFPCHGCVVGLWSKRLREAVDKAIHSTLNCRRGSKELFEWPITHQSQKSSCWNNGYGKIFLMSTPSWNEQNIQLIERVSKNVPRILICASTPATAMFVQLLYGIGLDRKQFYRMESDDIILNLSGRDQQTWKECKALIEEWQVSTLAPMFKDWTFSEAGNIFHLDSFDFISNISEYYPESFMNDFISYLNNLMDSSFLSDVELILPLEEEQTVSVSNAMSTYSDHLEGDRSRRYVSFHVHRLVLASRSNYFLKMFSSGMREMVQDKIQICNVDILSFQRMLNEIYQKPVYGTAKLDEDADLWLEFVNDVRVGDMFDVARFKKEASTCLRNLLNTSNVIHLANLSLECELFDLFQCATDFICSHFHEVSQETEFSCLREDCFLHILSRMDLEVQDENEVALIVLKWLEGNHSSSSVAQGLFFMKYHLHEFFQLEETSSGRILASEDIECHIYAKSGASSNRNVENLSNSLFTNDSVVSEVFEQPHSMIFESFQFVKLEPIKWIPPQFTFKVDEEKWLFLRREWNRIYGTIPRIAPGEVWIPYIPKLHSVGVLYYLGCFYGLQLGGTRVNPHKYNIVSITSSSGSRFAKLESLAESSVNRSCFALSNSSSLVWFALDLGAERVLACSFYTLAHDGSESNFLRNWCLEGSKDGKSWTVLKEHQNDETLQSPLQRATWRLEEPTSQVFYRYFRVIARPPCRKINLGSFEFYGRLRMKSLK
ncbi:BTB/POZ domain-containing protein At2g30600 [Galdieria sulphuraria]|nr:BTB/POZ domain-containing protein At2g30600 [Galdieria sulphuraria]